VLVSIFETLKNYAVKKRRGEYQQYSLMASEGDLFMTNVRKRFENTLSSKNLEQPEMFDLLEIMNEIKVEEIRQAVKTPVAQIRKSRSTMMVN